MSQQDNGSLVMLQGRIVWTSGDLFKGRVKLDENTRQPMVNERGEQIIEHGFGLAVPKAHVGDIWAAMHNEAYKIYPNRQLPPDFAWKYKDGDGIDHQGQPFANREGHAGCLVFALTGRLPIKYFRFENNNNIQINEGIKCGDYVNVQVQVKAHPPKGRGKAGLYLNPSAVQFLGFGKEIVNSPSGDQIFGVQAPPLPPGASAVPLAPMGNTPLVPTGGQYAPQSYQQPQAPAAPVMPHHGVLPQQFQPQAAAAYNPQAPSAPMPGMPGVGQYSQPQQPATSSGGQAPNYGGAPAAMPGVPGMAQAGVNPYGAPAVSQQGHGYAQQSPGYAAPGQPQQPGVMPQMPMMPQAPGYQ